MSNSKKIKPVALAIVELRKSEGIRQFVSQCKILLNNYFFKFCSKFLKGFQVNLKAYWAYFYLTNAAPSSSRKIGTSVASKYTLIYPSKFLLLSYLFLAIEILKQTGPFTTASL